MEPFEMSVGRLGETIIKVDISTVQQGLIYLRIDEDIVPLTRREAAALAEALNEAAGNSKKVR